MVHGILGYGELRVGQWVLGDYFNGIPDFLRNAGNHIFVPCLSMTRGTSERAKQLRQFITRNLAGEHFHLIAHSLGGLDCRYLVTHLGMGERVLTLTTVGTPHRGSPFADWGIRMFAGVTRPLVDFLRVPYQAYFDLTTTACRTFNDRTPDSPRVRYFSVAGRIDEEWRSLRWRLLQKIVEAREGPNDGVVSVTSANWGESLDIWPGDHLNLINWRNARAMRRGVWIDRTVLYGRIICKLADLGF
jgi:triacylglycerol lipase